MKDFDVGDENRTGAAIDLQVFVESDSAGIAERAAAYIAGLGRNAIVEKGFFTLALSGGHTPLTLFRLLASPKWQKHLGWGLSEWARTRVFWADERCVAPEHPESNFGNADRVLFGSLGHGETEFLFRMHGEAEPEAAAIAYAHQLCEYVPARLNGIPRFDCILLGMGEDGHTASLFPGSDLSPKGALVAVARAGHLGDRPESRRLTLTLPVLNAAACCLFLVSGSAKQKPLKAALNLLARPVLPVQHVRPVNGKLLWIVDRDACSAD